MQEKTLSSLFFKAGLNSLKVIFKQYMTDKISAPYGSWASEITSQFLTKGNCKSICELQVKGATPFWVEQTFPAGVRVLFERRADKSIVQWSPDGVSVSNSVYEYGGGSFCIVESGAIISTKTGLHHITNPKEARPLATNGEGEDIRYADLFPHKNFIFAVQEIHNTKNHEEEPKNLLVKVCIETGEVLPVVQGADFYAEPRVSPDGKYLVWMQWNKPNMPWDYTSIWIAELSPDNFSIAGEPRKLVGDDACYFAPQWANSELHLTADPTGFWNIYSVDVEKGGLKKNLYPVEMDLANPLWNLANDRAYAISESDLVIALDHTHSVLWHKSLTAENSDSRFIETLKSAGFTVFSFLTLSQHPTGKLFCIAEGPKRSCSLVEVDLKTYVVDVIRETRSLSELRALPLSSPQLHTFESDGVKVDGYFYPPSSLTYRDGDKPPPVVFFAHPGPTMRTTEALDLKKQYYTTRGFAVFDINYRGSTGYGRQFRDYLLGNWGVVDAADIINGAKYLAARGLVDRDQMCIIGNSAGGYLVFCALMHPENPFKASSSIYGVMDLLDMLKSSHKFEADYTAQLVAPYPERVDVYKERSAIYNLDKITTPVAFFHGTEDPVVNVSQSKLGFEKLREKGLPTTLQLFEGEGHGFRSAEAITKSVDMTYIFFCRVLGIKPSVDCEMEIFNLPPAGAKN